MTDRMPTQRDIDLAILEFKRLKARKRQNTAKAFGRSRPVIDASPAAKLKPHVRKYNR